MNTLLRGRWVVAWKDPRIVAMAGIVLGLVLAAVLLLLLGARRRESVTNNELGTGQIVKVRNCEYVVWTSGSVTTITHAGDCTWIGHTLANVPK